MSTIENEMESGFAGKCPRCGGNLFRYGLDSLCAKCGNRLGIQKTRRIMVDYNTGFVARLETGNIREDSGWYVKNTFNGMAVRDFPAPGRGDTVWLSDRGAEEFGLPLIQ